MSIFCKKTEEKKKTTNVTHARGNLQIQPILCKSSLKSKNVPKFQDVVK